VKNARSQLENLKGIGHFQDLYVGGRIILKLILRKHCVCRCGLVSSGSGEGPMRGSLNSDEIPVSIRGCQLLD
jgi:hypothetical protein